MRRFLTEPNAVAVSGALRVANGCEINKGRIIKIGAPRTYLACMQVVEYLRTFSYGRMGWSSLGGHPIITAGFAMLKKETLMEIGGFVSIPGEDFEISLRLHEIKRRLKQPYKIDYLPDATAWTEVPFNYHDLSSQRERWHGSMPAILWKMKRMLFNPKYSTLYNMVTVSLRSRVTILHKTLNDHPCLSSI